jgi:hypothetical protein
MGLFGRGSQKVIDDGRRVRGRIVAIDVREESGDSITRIDEYVVELSPSDAGRRFGVRQVLQPDDYVRLGMEVSAWVRDVDMVIDWASTLAEQGIAASNQLDRWKGDRDATRTGVTDALTGADKAARKGEAGTMTIAVLRWDSKFGGLTTALTIGGTVTIGTDEPYEVEIGRQHIPHYATHLAAVGRTVPVIVSERRLDRVTIDWPSAVEADPGLGMPPAADASPPRAAPSSAMSAGTGEPWTPPPPAVGFTPPAPIEGVSWAQYLVIEKAILDSGGYGRKTGELIESFGCSAKTYSVAGAAFGKLMVRDRELQRSYAAAMQ